MRVRSWRPVLVIVGIALLVAGLETSGEILRHIAEGSEYRVGGVVVAELAVWLTFVLLTPACLWMARRFPIDSTNWMRRVPLHLGAAIVFCLLHLVLDVLAQSALGRLPDGVTLRSFASLVGYYLGVESFIYWGIVGTFMLVQRQREARDRALAAARLEAALGEARLQALRAQLHPHFLFNALNGIAVMAMKGEGERVAHALGELGELLRATLDDDVPQFIPLTRELEFLERYLGLERLRFAARLQVERDVSSEALAALVPSFLLQPLVENAVHHGLSTVAGGSVALVAARDGATLRLEVRDRGPGFGARRPREGIGLANTRARLAAMYGAAQSLECLDDPAGGAIVRVRIPYRVSETTSGAGDAGGGRATAGDAASDQAGAAGRSAANHAP
ncbi:MAG TPA: histidine kinase [Candidatus Saccharimonadaceae bacterium]|jgi:glucose-6-phosphate-specific signal transduction histidine kinase|nr:histidine kinase [Candidatus Saccharimonadaceae bacterium]